MLFKKQENQQAKKANPIIGVLLFFISVFLLIVTGPLGFIYGLFHKLFTQGLSGIGTYALKIAVSIDQLGNVIMQHLLNMLWIKKEGYKFGNRDETISSALGRNRVLGTLTGFGRLIDKILDLIDPNHSLNSIDYYVEPSEDIIDKIAWVRVMDNKVLCVRSKGKELFYLPGGKREAGESDIQTLIREIKEELNVMLIPESTQLIGAFQAKADEQPSGVLVRLRCYTANYTGALEPQTEIEELAWIAYAERHKVSEAGQAVFHHLRKVGEL
ncbi:MAG: NUDIX domain-containing protein [Eudoraea sp.]|nr:NUDIX domain-containing protein [Eudoraea sp.]